MKLLKLSTIKLQHKIMLHSVIMVFLVLITAGLLIAHNVSMNVQNSTADKAMSIAQVVARVPAVQQALLSDNPSAVLQPVAERWRTATEAAFIVISNMDAIRFSHPIPEKLGTPMANLYRDPVLQGNEYIYIGKGSLEPSLRANVPIFHPDSGVQIGFVSVGFYLQDINEMFMESFKQVLFALFVGLLFSLAGAIYLAGNVKKAIFGLEPHEIATILKERTATLEAIREGVVAVDVEGRIRLVNNEAAKVLGINEQEMIGELIDAIIPRNGLNDVISSGIAVYDEEKYVGNTIILANSVPIIVDQKVSGAVITFRDRTEVNRMAEALTGVHRFVDILRAQTHEFKNKMHTISGLIQLGQYDEAIRFATDGNISRQGLFNQLNGRIRDSVIFGLLLGKASVMREKGIDFSIDGDSYLEELPVHVTSGDIVLVLGNLLQNAIEAVADAEEKLVYVSILQDMAELTILVQNSGPWINEEVAEAIFQQGVTTKPNGSGLGLALVMEKLQLVRGSIVQNNLPLGGVQFAVTIPYSQGW